jgi:hypothetical protein
VTRDPSAVGEKNPATALWLLRQRWSNLDKIMNTKAQSFNQRVRQIFRRGVGRHDPMLVFNMSIFNYTDGWSRTFSKNEYARFYA